MSRGQESQDFTVVKEEKVQLKATLTSVAMKPTTRSNNKITDLERRKIGSCLCPFGAVVCRQQEKDIWRQIAYEYSYRIKGLQKHVSKEEHCYEPHSEITKWKWSFVMTQKTLSGQ